MNALFVEDARLHEGGFFGVWRRGDVVGVRITGPLTDERNPVWRAWLDARFAVDGWPRFIALDVKDAIPAASLPKRLQTALWSKQALSTIEYGCVQLGREASVSLTVRATLRIAGIGNISLHTTDDAFDADVGQMLAGVCPTGTTRADPAR
jgi:hypothetical protein